MARCDKCGAEGVKWQGDPATTTLSLYEPDGGLHVCRPEDRWKEYARKVEEAKARKESMQKFFDGYL